jgi:hypothetical protein
MNQSFFLKSSLVAIALTVSLISCAKDEVIPVSELPAEMKAYISTHFPSNTILQVVKDVDGLTKTYDVLLSERISLEFNRQKEIIDIDSEIALPNSVIPEQIRQYVTANYPSNVITDWELDDRNQQVQLNNGLDLKFNMNGDFLRIDY